MLLYTSVLLLHIDGLLLLRGLTECCWVNRDFRGRV